MRKLLCLSVCSVVCGCSSLVIITPSGYTVKRHNVLTRYSVGPIYIQTTNALVIVDGVVSGTDTNAVKAVGKAAVVAASAAVKAAL